MSNRFPTTRELDRMGADAGAYFDAQFDEIERAIGMADAAGDAVARRELCRDKARLERLHAAYFDTGGGEAA